MILRIYQLFLIFLLIALITKTSTNILNIIQNLKLLIPKTLYKELYDRTFSLKYLTKLSNGEPLSNGSGTTWLLDYHKYTNQKR
nr:hypothetical protein [Mycoplasmopsis bovis]